MRVYLKSFTLRKILIEKNLSQNWLAKRLKISSGYMSQLMRGFRRPSSNLRKKLQDIFISMDFEDLFEIKEKEE
jgi:transcriptional regulator with XRE-family HTH domain